MTLARCINCSARSAASPCQSSTPCAMTSGHLVSIAPVCAERVSRLTVPAPERAVACAAIKAAPPYPASPPTTNTWPECPLWATGERSSAGVRNIRLSIPRADAGTGGTGKVRACATPRSSNSNSPAKAGAMPVYKPCLRATTIRQISAMTACCSACPVSAHIPVGTSIDSTGASSWFTRSTACETKGRSAPLQPIPSRASTSTVCCRRQEDIQCVAPDRSNTLQGTSAASAAWAAKAASPCNVPGAVSANICTDRPSARA